MFISFSPIQSAGTRPAFRDKTATFSAMNCMLQVKQSSLKRIERESTEKGNQVLRRVGIFRLIRLDSSATELVLDLSNQLLVGSVDSQRVISEIRGTKSKSTGHIRQTICWLCLRAIWKIASFTNALYKSIGDSLYTALKSGRSPLLSGRDAQ